MQQSISASCVMKGEMNLYREKICVPLDIHGRFAYIPINEPLAF